MKQASKQGGSGCLCYPDFVWGWIKTLSWFCEYAMAYNKSRGCVKSSRLSRCALQQRRSTGSNSFSIYAKGLHELSITVYILCSVILNGQCALITLLLGNSWREPLCACSAFRGAILTHNSWKGSLKAPVSLWGETGTFAHTIQGDPISPHHLGLSLLEKRD